jgi:RimJ/RimL family protein N-acetyltransferase
MVDDLSRQQTARLLLTRIGTADYAELCRMHRDPEVMATLGGIRSDEVSAGILAQLMAHWDAHGFGYWMAHDRATGAFVGRGGLRRVVVGGGDEIEVGYALMPQYWGHGLATELARECARIGFERLGQRELVAFTLPTNQKSRAVMQRVGFTYERDVIWAGMPHVLYRLRSAAWQSGGQP